MRANWFKLVLLVGFFTAFFGCRTTKPQIKPTTPAPEEYKLPPEEARYKDTPTFPQDPLDQATLKKKDNTPGTGSITGPGGHGM